MGRGGGSRAAGAIAHMEMGEVFKTAGFRRARGRARGSCGDADRDDARRAVKRVADGLVPERHENTTGHAATGGASTLAMPLELFELSVDQSTSVTPVCPRRSLAEALCA